MKAFDIKTEIKEFDNFTAFADEAKIGNQDLILTGEHTYLEFIEPSGVEAQTLFREKYGKGEPTDSMINAILSELSGRKFDRIIAVGGGSIIDIAPMEAEPCNILSDGVNILHVFFHGIGVIEA